MLSPMKRVELVTLVLALSALAACGGGGGGDDGTPLPTTQSLQGLWQGTWTTPTNQLAASAVVLPDGRAWLVGTDENGAVRLVKAAFAVEGSRLTSNGLQHVPGAAGTTAVTANVNVKPASTLDGTLTIDGAVNNFSLNYQPRYDTAAVLADLAGNWSATQSGGAVTVTWAISAPGVVTGQSTTGCTYNGLLQARAEAKAVVDVAVNETCAGTTTQLTGVATLNSGRLSVTTTTNDETAAVLLSMQR